MGLALVTWQRFEFAPSESGTGSGKRGPGYKMSTNCKSPKSFASILFALLVLCMLRGLAAADSPALAPLATPVLVGDTLNLSGRGFSAGSMVNFFVSTPNGS